MNSLADTNPSPRRDSMSSLNRHGSFSSRSTSSHANTTTTKDPLKELEKFTRYFLIKTVQVVVQSRINAFRTQTTESKPLGNDWFNLNIKDIPEVSEKVKRLIDKDGFSLRSNWRICCEISLRARDGGRVILEHWIITHRSLLRNYLRLLKEGNNAFDQQQQSLGTTSSSTLRTPANNISDSNSADHKSSATTPISGANNGQRSNSNSPSPGRSRTATFSHTMRTRLNSIDDDMMHETQQATSNGIKNYDIKPSTSCYTLTSSPLCNNPVTDDTGLIQGSDNQNSRIVNSATTNSISSKLGSPNRSSMNTSNTSPSTNVQARTKTLANVMSSIHLSSLYNRMTLLLKTIMTTSHIVPAYQLSSTISQDESRDIHYRIYIVNRIHPSPSSPGSNIMNRHSPRDSLDGENSFNRSSGSSGSPNRRSSFTLGHMNIRDFVSPHELEHFCPIIVLGSAKSDLNELEVSLCYRNDIRDSSQIAKACPLRASYGTILDRDCITAAKQLLAGNDQQITSPTDQPDCKTKSSDENNINDPPKCPDEPLRPAFAHTESRLDYSDPDLNMIEPMFDSLLRVKDDHIMNPQHVDDSTTTKQTNTSNSNGTSSSNKSDFFNPQPRSQPIDVQMNPLRLESVVSLENNNQPCGSTPKSLTDSFVFVELNPPFASDEQNDINSFFHGPAPKFNQHNDSCRDADEIANQLAVIEADASKIDEFVDNICISEDDENEDDDRDRNGQRELDEEGSMDDGFMNKI